MKIEEESKRGEDEDLEGLGEEAIALGRDGVELNIPGRGETLARGVLPLALNMVELVEEGGVDESGPDGGASGDDATVGLEQVLPRVANRGENALAQQLRVEDLTEGRGDKDQGRIGRRAYVTRTSALRSRSPLGPTVRAVDILGSTWTRS